MKKVLLSISLVALLYSCSSDDNVNTGIPTGDKPYSNGVIILNEGNFQSSNANASYISNDLSVQHNNIFSTANNSEFIGDVAQSLAFYKDFAFIVVNNSNTIEVVNRYTFQKVAQITQELSLPRRIVVKNSKIYVTNSASKKVTIYNADNYQFITSVELDSDPEYIVANNNYVYVQSNSYASQKVVEVISLSDNVNVTDLTFEYASNGLAVDNASGNVYAVTSDATKSEIHMISGLTVSKTVSSNAVTSARYAVIDNNNFYFVSANNVYKTSLQLTSFPETKVLSVEENGFSTFYGFNVIDNKVYSADAKGFTDNGVVSIYDLNGALLKQFSTGAIGPNGFYKN